MLASELYALSQGTVCLGEEECHWCGARCKRHWLHDDPPRPQYVRPVLPLASKRPGNAYVCTGCWHFRRKSVTVRYFSGRVVDRRSPCDHTWFVTEEGATSVDKKNPHDIEDLYNVLLRPPTTFCLMVHSGVPNMLQFAAANEFREVRANTPLKFTLANATHEYTVYDLEQALKNPTLDGDGPGVRALLKEYGRPEVFVEKDEKKARGGQQKRQEESGTYVNRIVSSKDRTLRSA